MLKAGDALLLVILLLGVVIRRLRVCVWGVLSREEGGGVRARAGGLQVKSHSASQAHVSPIPKGERWRLDENGRAGGGGVPSAR